MMYPTILQRAGVRPDGRSIHGGRKVTLNLGTFAIGCSEEIHTLITPRACARGKP